MVKRAPPATPVRACRSTSRMCEHNVHAATSTTLRREVARGNCERNRRGRSERDHRHHTGSNTSGAAPLGAARAGGRRYGSPPPHPAPRPPPLLDRPSKNLDCEELVLARRSASAASIEKSRALTGWCPPTMSTHRPTPNGSSTAARGRSCRPRREGGKRQALPSPSACSQLCLPLWQCSSSSRRMLHRLQESRSSPRQVAPHSRAPVCTTSASAAQEAPSTR